MFTGLIQTLGTIQSLGVATTTASSASAAIYRLVIDAQSWDHRPVLGESIAVNGCCLTLAEAPSTPGRLVFEVVPETLAKTTLGGLRQGHRVNLERSLRADDLLGGHFVQGHVEGVGRVIHVQAGDDWRVRIQPPAGELVACIAPKGGITVEGVSLTVAAVSLGESWFEVALIPTTLKLTTLGDLKTGDRVNLETDILTRSVVHAIKWYELTRANERISGGGQRG
jgi:riboflavin synthase